MTGPVAGPARADFVVDGVVLDDTLSYLFEPGTLDALRGSTEPWAVLIRLVLQGRLHEADAQVVLDGITRPRDPAAVYLALGRLAAVADDISGGDWWRLVRGLSRRITAGQVGRVRQAGADLELLRAEGVGALRHFDPSAVLTAEAWETAVRSREQEIQAVAEEVTRG
jgi:hypothetical protein